MKQQIDALQKFQNQLLSTFNAQDLTYFKRSGWDGMLTSIDRLYATMLHDWDVLRKDSDSIEKAVRSLEWSITPFVKKGEKPTPEASKVAKVVEDALWRRTPQTLGTYAHSFVQLLGSIVHAEFRGQNVHRIDWKNDGKLVYPAAYVQLPPQFLRWEIEPGKPDLLLHVPDGEVAKPVPFKPYQYIVALNNTGPDHPLYNATYYSLVAWFCAAKNGLGWFMQYAEQHHLPKPVFHYDNDEDREQIIKDLSQERVINAFLLYGDKQVEWATTPTGTTMPQKELLELSEARCHKAILGQTLTSDTSKGGGSLAQARVHAGVQADEVMKHAEFVADVINRQLIPAIVHLNFGKVEGLPLPELRYKLPQAAANIERAQFWSQVLQIPGISVVKSEVYDSLGIAMPTEDDEVLSTPDQQQNDLAGLMQQLGGGEEQPTKQKPKSYEPKKEDKEELAVAARTRSTNKLTQALPAWLAPIKKKLMEARSAGATFDELRSQMLTWRADTDALAAAFAENVEAGLRGEDEEKVEAAAGTDDDRRSQPIVMPDGSKCYTEDCEKHKKRENYTIPTIKEAKKELKNAFLSVKNKNVPVGKNVIILKKANKRTAKEVKSLCGRDIGKYFHTISITELQHAINRHPNLTEYDMNLIFDIVDNWDELKYTLKDNVARLEYHKTHKGKQYVLVERIGRKRRDPKDLHSLQFTTMYW